MKKLTLVLCLVAGFATSSFSQIKKKAQATITIKTPTVQCEECKKRIEDYMKREDGVIRTVVDFKRHTTKVTYWTDRTNPENIKTAIANVGYDADDVTANPESYNKLPKCCKKPS
jgi:copper chaperone CopZ